MFISLEGNDVTPVAAFTRAADASVAQTQTEEALRRMVDTMENAPDSEAQAAGVGVWVKFLREMDAVSDAPMQPKPRKGR